MQGDCQGASTADLPVTTTSTQDLAPLKAGQCILFSREDMLVLFTSDIWLDNLYLRALFENVPSGVEREGSFISLAAVPKNPGPRRGSVSRYMTRMTFQGDNVGPVMGLFADESVYVEGAVLLGLYTIDMSVKPCTSLHPLLTLSLGLREVVIFRCFARSSLSA